MTEMVLSIVREEEPETSEAAYKAMHFQLLDLLSIQLSNLGLVMKLKPVPVQPVLIHVVHLRPARALPLVMMFWKLLGRLMHWPRSAVPVYLRPRKLASLQRSMSWAGARASREISSAGTATGEAATRARVARRVVRVVNCILVVWGGWFGFLGWWVLKSGRLFV